MATSGSIDYTQNRDQISADALQLIGALGAGETASSNDLTFCSSILNKMVKAWEGQGIHLWKQTTASVTLVADTYSYTLSPRPLNVISCRYRYGTGPLDRVMYKYGRAEYDAIPTKTTSTGPCTIFHYSPGLSTGTLLVWPVPTSSEVTNSDTLVYTYQQSIEDFDSASDTPDFPQEWLEAITYNLAVRIAPAYGKNLTKTAPEIVGLAQMALAEMLAWDSEEGSVQISPKKR